MAKLVWLLIALMAVLLVAFYLDWGLLVGATGGAVFVLSIVIIFDLIDLALKWKKGEEG